MLLKKLLITFCVMALVVGCSNEQPTSPVVNIDIETINATTEDVQGDNDLLQQEAEAFGEALESGKYRFSVDENGDLTLYDGVNIPEGEDELYAEFLKLSQIPDSDKRALASTATSALSSYWRYAVWREVCYALSRTKYLQGQRGQSRRTYYYGNKWWLAGDWNYDGKGYGIGGTCKVFARRALQRATGYKYNLPSGYRYAYGSISWCKPGDIIQRSDIYGTPHTAMVFSILARDRYGRATRIDVIDANYIGGIGKGMIARHYLPIWGYNLNQFKVW